MSKEFIIVLQVDPPLALSPKTFSTAVVKQFEPEGGRTRYWVIIYDQFLIEKFGQHHDYYYSKVEGEKEKKYANFSVSDRPDIQLLHESIMKAIETYRERY